MSLLQTGGSLRDTASVSVGAIVEVTSEVISTERGERNSEARLRATITDFIKKRIVYICTVDRARMQYNMRGTVLVHATRLPPNEHLYP